MTFSALGTWVHRPSEEKKKLGLFGGATASASDDELCNREKCGLQIFKQTFDVSTFEKHSCKKWLNSLLLQICPPAQAAHR